jgi:hypothetical protein
MKENITIKFFPLMRLKCHRFPGFIGTGMLKNVILRRQTLLFVALFMSLSLIHNVPLEARPVDAVVMIDTSSGMAYCFEEIKDFMVKQLIGEQLRSGDTIHVLSFGEDAEYQISRTIRDSRAVEQVRERIMLLQPQEVHSDLVAAFKAIYDYTLDLPVESQKEVLIFSKGIHNPSPVSPYPVSARNSSDIGTLSSLMRRNGWEVRIIQIPGSNDEEIQNLLALAGRELSRDIVVYKGLDNSFPYRATGQLEIRYPEHIGTIKGTFTLAVTAVNHLSVPSSLRIEEVIINGTAALEREYSVGVKGGAEREIRLALSVPDHLDPGERVLEIELITGEGKRSFPARASIPATLQDPASGGFSGFSPPLLLFLLGLAVLLVPIILAVRHSFLVSSSSSEEDHYCAPSESPAGEITMAVKKPSPPGSSTTMYTKKQIMKARTAGKLAVEMIVDGQNRKVGKRNIRWMNDGDTLSVGGSGADHFLVFLYPVPHCIGYLERSDTSFTFTPEEPRRFPGLEGNSFQDCLGKTISCRVNESITLVMKFQLWVSPLESLNSSLHITDNPGFPGKKTKK